MSEATSGIKLVVLTAAPGYCFAHPGYALKRFGVVIEEY
jgi:hypothetical protein